MTVVCDMITMQIPLMPKGVEHDTYSHIIEGMQGGAMALLDEVLPAR
ncbi:MAG: hypothetical protein DDT26_01450 [Dehalococcoidia bacterium]|nr:hypothetical protein [Chloroflexota bacterium]